MALSSISNAPLANSHVSQQKPGTAAEQSEGKKSNLSSDSNFSGKEFDDTVTLSQTEKTADLSKVVDAKSVEKILPRTMRAILQDSKTAVSTQANFSSETAQKFLNEK